jgi:hypothetical protein
VVGLGVGNPHVPAANNKNFDGICHECCCS